MSHTGVGGAAAAEGPLVGPAAGGTLDGQQDVAASTGRFQVSLFAGHLVGVEHDPEGPVVEPVLDSHEVLAEVAPLPVPLGPLVFLDHVGAGQAGLKILAVTEDLVGPEVGDRALAEQVDVSALVGSRNLVGVLVEPLADVGFAAADQCRVDSRQQSLEFLAFGSALLVGQGTVVSGLAAEELLPLVGGESAVGQDVVREVLVVPD